MATTPAIAEVIGRLIALGYPGAPTSEELLDVVVAAWAEDLDDMTDHDLHEAARAYRRSTAAEDRFFPTPGRLRAHAVTVQAVAQLGTEAEVDTAFAAFRSRMTRLDGYGGPERGARELARDPFENAAMWAGLGAVGGARAWYASEVGDRAVARIWREAYRAARQAQTRDPQVARSLISVVPRAIEGKR